MKDSSGLQEKRGRLLLHQGPAPLLTGSGTTLLLVCLTLFGCEDDGTRTPRLVGSATLQWAVEGSVPDHELPFSGFEDGAIGPAGTVAVADENLQRVLVFNSDGSFSHSLGREGEGPGEFRDPELLGFHEDTLWVSDPRNARFTWFTPDGDIAGTVTYGERLVPGTPWFSRDGHALVTGEILADLRLPSAMIADTVLRVPVTVVDTTGGIHVVDSLDGINPVGYRLEMGGGRTAYPPQPIEGRPIVRAAEDGRSFITLERPPSRSETGEFTVTRYDADHNVDARFAIEYTAISVDSTTLDSVKHRFGGDEPGGFLERIGGFTTVREAIWLPPSLPPVSQAFADSGGLWLRREIFQERGIWERYDNRGALKARIALPTHFRGLAASERTLVGWVRDSLDVPTLQKYVVDRD